MSALRTRLAPSPTGALHLGNARTFVINWALARQQGWEILLRIDDLDGPRVKRGAAEQAVEDLQWLGLDWDLGPVFQSESLAPYEDALRQLSTAGRVYPCRCTRTQIAAASAPNEGDHELRYPGTCRDRREGFSHLEAGEQCWRLRIPDRPVAFVDQLHGEQVIDVQGEVGDFQVATKAGVPSYQLAAAVDDQRQGVTAIVRGDDLIASTARQQAVREALGLEGSLQHWHLPLVVGPDGRRLAKRHGDSRLSHYRDLSVPPQRVLGLLRHWCGGPQEPCDARQFLAEFDIAQLSSERIVMTPADDRWLLAT